MFQAIDSPYLVNDSKSFKISDLQSFPPRGAPGKKACKKALQDQIEQLRDLQRILYASDHHGVLLVFQAMDAAGKDGTIRAVMSGVNPAGCQVYSFKKPSSEELDHDFLWRTNRCLPERGRIGIFNRSYYEEVLVVRVHPELLKYQKLPTGLDLENVWRERMEAIKSYETYLARQGYVILKFWLNVSRDEQKRRFLDRIDEPSKNWKFSSADIRERGYWDDYMSAYQDALRKTSTSSAPWYAIPADNKPFMRLKVAEVIVESLKSLNMSYPVLDQKEKSRLQEMRELLEAEDR